MDGLIYRAINKINGKIYIGQTTKTLEQRKRSHKNKSRGKKICYFWNAIRKHGFDKFDWSIICHIVAPTDILLLEYLNIAEDMWINKLNTMNPISGYNLKTNGSSGKLSESTKKKISNSMKGKSRSKESIKKMLQSRTYSKGENHPMYGIDRSGNKGPMYGAKHSEETKEKMKKAKTGKKRKPFTDEHRKKMSIAHKGKNIGSKSACWKGDNVTDKTFRSRKRRKLLSEK